MLSTFLSISILFAAPQELLVTQSTTTPRQVMQFNGVSVEIQQESLAALRSRGTVIIPDFPLGNDGTVDLRLQRFDVFTPEATVLVGSVGLDGKVIHRTMARPNIVLLRGTIEGDPSSRVFLAFGEHTTNGLIERNGRTYVLAKNDTEGWTAVYNINDVDPEQMNWVDFKCSVEDAAIPVLQERSKQRQNRDVGCQALQIAVDTDWEFTGDLFGGNTAASSEYATTLIGGMSTIYSSDLNIETQISFLRLWNDSSDPWTASSTGAQLPQFRSFWESNMSDVPRHLAHLLSGRPLGGGIAWVAVVCTNYGYAVSGNLQGSFPLPLEDNNANNWDIIVVSHETGHNCGTFHTHQYDPPIENCGYPDCESPFGGTIMSYCHQCSGGLSNIVLSFHSQVQSTIENYLANDVSCSLVCDQSIPGSCCIETLCTETSSENCDLLGGVFLGTGTQCESGGCELQLPGACCLDGEGACTDLDPDGCSAVQGTFLGSGTTCDSGWCDPSTAFACCFAEECTELSLFDCTNAGGFWAGVGSSCVSGGCDPLENDFCEIATVVTSGIWNFTTLGAITDDDPYDNEDCNEEFLGGMFSDIWFSFTACESSSLLVSTCNLVDFDSDIVVYQGSCSDKVQVECNGDGDGCGGFSSEVELDVISGETYLIRIGGFSQTMSGNGQLVIGGQNCQPDVPCLGDVTGDGVIDISDLLAIVDHWGESSIQYDIDENGIVGIGDLLIITGNWGMCDN